MAIKKTVSIKVLDKTADTAFVKEHRLDDKVYIYDLAESITNEEGEVSYNYLATNRYSPDNDAPFTLTQEEEDELNGVTEE